MSNNSALPSKQTAIRQTFLRTQGSYHHWHQTKAREEQNCQKEVNRPRSMASEQHGGYDCGFVERPQELQTDCPICMVVLREPFQVTCCGNSYCRTCIELVRTKEKACPTCNEANFSAFPNKGLQRALYSFRVRCVHQKNGCEWVGELGELDGHLNLHPELGKQLNGCEFAAVACTHCCEHVQRCHVHAHESECPQQASNCQELEKEKQGHFMYYRILLPLQL